MYPKKVSLDLCMGEWWIIFIHLSTLGNKNVEHFINNSYLFDPSSNMNTLFKPR